METISRHAVKYRTERYFKNKKKLINNFTYFDLSFSFRIAVRPPIFGDSTGFLFFCQALAEITTCFIWKGSTLLFSLFLSHVVNFPLSIQCILRFQFLLSLSVMDSSYLDWNLKAHCHPWISYGHTESISQAHSKNIHTGVKFLFNQLSFNIHWKIMLKYFTPD